MKLLGVIETDIGVWRCLCINVIPIVIANITITIAIILDMRMLIVIGMITHAITNFGSPPNNKYPQYEYKPYCDRPIF